MCKIRFWPAESQEGFSFSRFMKFRTPPPVGLDETKVKIHPVLHRIPTKLEKPVALLTGVMMIANNGGITKVSGVQDLLHRK